MRGFRIEAILDEAPVTLRLKPMESEQNLWKVVVEEHGLQEDEEELISNGRVVGLVMTYVDDIFISGQKEVVKEVAAKFQSTWKTLTPEEAGEVPVRFLGMEVTSRGVEGEDQMEWRMTQESYVKDLFAR